jgi:hypothetical protein
VEHPPPRGIDRIRCGIEHAQAGIETGRAVKPIVVSPALEANVPGFSLINAAQLDFSIRLGGKAFVFQN